MTEFLARLKRRKLVQWALAYVAFAFALLQGVDIVAQRFGWPASIERLLILLLAIGFFVALVLAWYHGERGAQRVSGTEIMILALLLAIGGGFLWRLERAPGPDATPGPAAVQRNPGKAAPRNAAMASPPRESPAAAIPAKSVAVLPFENLSTDKGNAYFADGMQDLILTKLAEIGDLKVISRTSTAKYASHPDDLKTIGQQLGVATILEGSVQKAGNQVLINVQLIDARKDSHIWAQSYTRTLDNIFGVEGEVAQKVADALQTRLSGAQSAMMAAVPTQNQAAMDLFLRAEYQAREGTQRNGIAGWKVAIPLYRQAIGLDPGFALAYARVSIVESNLAWRGGGGEDVERLLKQASEDARQAMKLEPGLADAHLALGYCDYYGRSDYDAALRAFAAALALQPSDAEAFTAQGYVERRQGRFDEAMASFRQAFALNPRDSESAFVLGETSMAVGHYSQAQDWFRRALALNPEALDAKYDNVWAILLETGDIPRALDAARGDGPLMKQRRVSMLTFQRKYNDALRLLDSIPDTPENFWAYRKVLVRAEILRFMGNSKDARPLFAQVREWARAELAARRDARSPLLFSSLAWNDLAVADLALGDRQGALDAVAKSLAIAESSPDWFDRPKAWTLASQLYAEAGRPDLAVPLLAKVLATRGVGNIYSPVLLWLDPWLDPLRGDPRFKALLQKYAKYKPAVIPVAPSPAADTDRGAHG